MRTTLTLDPDVAAALRALAQERGVPFKDVVNSALRRGLREASATPQRYVMPARVMGLRAEVDLDKALHLAADLEDAELARKLDLRK